MDSAPLGGGYATPENEQQIEQMRSVASCAVEEACASQRPLWSIDGIDGSETNKTLHFFAFIKY